LKKSLAALFILVLIPVFPALGASDPPAKTTPDASHSDGWQSSKYDDLFEKVFGYRRRLPDRLLIPFLIGSRQFGKIEVFLANEHKDIRVSADTVLDQVTPFVKRSVRDRLRTQVDSRNRLGVSDLKEVGFDVAFDESALAFRLKIPAELRRIKTVGQKDSRLPPSIEYAIEPNPLSAFVNIRVGQDFIHESTNSTRSYRNTTAANLDTAINYKNFVLESIFEYSEDTSWRRGNARLVHDRPDRLLRFCLGDLIIPLRGFQSAPAMGGIGISKDFSLQPYAMIRPFTSKEVFISRPSTVEVFVNDVLVETLRVQPGPYDFYQTALNHGINHVKIRVRNDLGEEEWIDFDMFYSSAGLKKGLSQYSFNLGFLREKQNNHYEYDSKALISSFFYRLGISNNHTLGGYLQTAPSQLLVGLENDWSSFLGNINANIAVSRTPQADVDYAAQILYYYYNNNPIFNPYHRSWRASIEYTGRRFARINEKDPDKMIAWLLTGSVNQDLSNTLSGSLSASYGVARPDSNLEDNTEAVISSYHFFPPKNSSIFF